MTSISTLPAPPEASLIDDPHQLDLQVTSWLRFEAIGVDTEFVRTRTYYARLGLIQVGDPQACWLVDHVALSDAASAPSVSRLAALFRDPTVVKVLHSPGEDLEVLMHSLGVVPEPLFDTQVAATLAGLGPAPGYRRLVQVLFGVELPKTHQRSDWVRRPLSADQILYAGLDAAYLLPAREVLQERLESLGRLAWAEEEFRRLLAACRARLDPEQVFQRLHKSSLNPEQAGALAELVGWREQEAQRRDLPRGFVLKDEVLVAIAKASPRDVRALGGVRLLGPKQVRQYGDGLVEVVRRGRRRPREVPRRKPRGPNSSSQVAALRETVERVAAQLDLPAEFLASKRVIEQLVQNHRSGVRRLPDELSGWRAEVIGEPMLARLDS